MSGGAAALRLILLEERYAVGRLAAEAEAPRRVPGDRLFSLTWTGGELSVVCPQERLSPGCECESGFRALEVEGPLDFALVGVLSRLTAALAVAGIPVFVLSTFATDYLLVREERLGEAITALEGSGCAVR